jgi:hypothetical protein
MGFLSEDHVRLLYASRRARIELNENVGPDANEPLVAAPLPTANTACVPDVTLIRRVGVTTCTVCAKPKLDEVDEDAVCPAMPEGSCVLDAVPMLALMLSTEEVAGV